MIDFIPDPIAIQLGPIPIYWYGIGYALGLAAVILVLMREARRVGLDTSLIPNGLLVVAVSALIGGRLYHVIDQWHLYQDDPIRVILPPYTGLGAYGGLVTGAVAVWVFTRYHRQPFWRWADVAAPAVFAMQAIARWGNFFNQELYGPPTTLPWGIAIQCRHRVPEYACPPGSDPLATLGQHFHPLFLYESISGALGLLALLWIGRRFRDRLRPGDLVLVFFMWYGAVRFALETLRTNNWTFFDVPVAQIVSAAFVLGALAILLLRHRQPPSRREGAEVAPGATPAAGSTPEPASAARAADAGPAPRDGGVPPAAPAD